MVVSELATCAASELAENLAEELGVRLVKKEAASIAVAFLTTEALKVCDRPSFTSLLPNA